MFHIFKKKYTKRRYCQQDHFTKAICSMFLIGPSCKEGQHDDRFYAHLCMIASALLSRVALLGILHQKRSFITSRRYTITSSPLWGTQKEANQPKEDSATNSPQVLRWSAAGILMIIHSATFTITSQRKSWSNFFPLGLDFTPRDKSKFKCQAEWKATDGVISQF